MIEGSKITAPINIADPYTVMGVGKLNGTWYDVAHICGNTHGKINPNSRNKPERIDTPTEITDAQRKSNNFGWNIPSFQMSNLPGTASSETNLWKWQYLAPRVNTDWSRLTDFNNYNHRATGHIRDLYVGNGKGHKPVVVPREYLSQVPTKLYWAELSLDNGAEILMNELMTTSGNVANMYLTLVIALNRNNQGAVFERSVWAQSPQTIQQAYDQSLGSIRAEVNTARLVEDGILSDVDGFRQTICAAFLAPKMDGTTWPYGVSIKKDSFIPVYYNTDYAVYGDGGEGGDLPATTINISQAPAYAAGSAYGVVRLVNEDGNLCAYVLSGVDITISHARASYEGYLQVELTIVELGITWESSSLGFKINVGDTRTSPTKVTIPMDSNKQIIGSAQTGGTYTLRTKIFTTGAVKVTGSIQSEEPVSIVG